MPLDCIVKHNVFSDDQIHYLDTCIQNICTVWDYESDGKLYSKNHAWDFHSDEAKSVRDILEPHLPKNIKVNHSKIIESFYPYELHTDVYAGGDDSSSDVQYTFIIPLDDYDSNTFVFNEYSYGGSNEFEDFKKQYTGDLKLKISREDALRLTHLYPKDLLYLSLKEKFTWKKGNMLAFDRNCFHCSDNYLKTGHTSKRAIILWTVKES